MATNAAFVFVKPHANTEAVQKLVSEGLAARGITIIKEGEITGPQIEEGKLIDQHYYAIASKATLLKPKDIPVPADKFEEFFGESWASVLESGKAYNALDACALLEVDAFGLEGLWRGLKSDPKALIKFGGGFYCGKIATDKADCGYIYCFNAFFMSMRSAFVKDDVSLHFYQVEWPADKLAWADFRGKVLGPTDPAAAPADALRGMILADWEKLGLKSEPNTGDNGVHASASPFEGLAERLNWLKADVTTDVFGKRLLEAGVSEETIKAWSVDPQVAGVGSLFDSVEDMDADECLAKLVEINKA